MLTRHIRMVSAFGWWLVHSDGCPNRITGRVICGVTWKGITLNWLLCMWMYPVGVKTPRKWSLKLRNFIGLFVLKSNNQKIHNSVIIQNIVILSYISMYKYLKYLYIKFGYLWSTGGNLLWPFSDLLDRLSPPTRRRARTTKWD